MEFQILSYIAAFITALIGFYLAKSVKRKNDADALSEMTDAAVKLVEAKNDEVDRMKLELTTYKLYVEYLSAWIKCKNPGQPKSIDTFTK